ncbi:MAG: hypothetical protein RB191_23790 [Terriglobia bacterium]|nr:hypothetical protein [Terriglobia bacterium]
MKSRPWFGTDPVAILSRAAVCSLMFCSGCLQHKVSVVDGYRIDDKGGIPMLVPIAAPNMNSGEFQTVTVTLLPGRSAAKIRVIKDCAIQGGVFSLQAGSSSNNRSWVISSPRTSDWDTVSGQADVDAQWKRFTSELSRMHDQGCFPSGLSTQFIRSAIAERIPLPANLVPIFMYSVRGERFVNLVPGMEIRIQKVLSTGTSINGGSGTSLRLLTVNYDVVSRHDGGIGLRLNHRPDREQRASLGTEDRQFLTLDQRFAPTSMLRLFLQGFSEEKQRKSESGPILIGASDATRLDLLTDLIRKRDSVACVSSLGVVCVDLPTGSVSLSSIIWINGRRTASAFGTSLASQLFRLPQPKQAEALESVQVIRQLSLHRYAGIQIARTVEGASQLLLLPGDRIEWKY